MEYNIDSSRDGKTMNQIFEKGKITVLLDSYCAGSSGKGKLESFVVKHSDNITFVATTNSANASHIVVDGGKEMMFKCLPASSYMHEKLQAVYLGFGSVFEVKTLLYEIEMAGIPRYKVRIHPKAGIITQIDIDFEKGLCDLDGNYFDKMGEGTLKGGTTASGSGAVRCKKTVRHKTLVFAKDIPELSDMISVTEVDIMERLAKGESGLLCIGQGGPLSYGNWRFGKNSTSRNVSVVAGLDDMMLPLSTVSNVIGNGRCFPIKIANYKNLSVPDVEYTIYEPSKSEMENIDEIIKDKFDPKLFRAIIVTEAYQPAKIKILTQPNVFVTAPDLEKYPNYPIQKIDSYSGDWYPDQEEITWESIEAGYGKEIPNKIKRTSLTQLLRKTATFSKIALDEGIVYNQVNGNHYIVLNFTNWIDYNVEDKTDIITDKVKSWVDENMIPILSRYPNVKLLLLGTGAETDSFIVLK